MAEGEWPFFLIGAALALSLWGRWYWQSFLDPRLGARKLNRLWLQAVPPLCLLLLYCMLRKLAAVDVRNAPWEIGFYLLLGALWLALVERLALYLGLSARDDVFERNNPAALVACSGLLLGGNLAFAGANVGEGPGWWVVVFCAALATAGLALAWWTLNAVTGVADAISVDRDLASGGRAAGFFVGNGLLFGQAVAGDWTSASATLKDLLKFGWPALILWLLACAFEWWLRPTPRRPQRRPALAGLLPALLYTGFGLAVAWAFWQK